MDAPVRYSDDPVPPSRWRVVGKSVWLVLLTIGSVLVCLPLLVAGVLCAFVASVFLQGFQACWAKMRP